MRTWGRQIVPHFGGLHLAEGPTDPARRRTLGVSRFRTGPVSVDREWLRMDDTLNPRRTIAVTNELSTLERVRLLVEILAIVLTGAWAIYTFVYVERIKPQSEPAETQFSSTFERGKPHGRIDNATITVTAHNSGRADVDIYADAISIYGDRLGPKSSAEIENTATQMAETHLLPVIRHDLLYSLGRLREGITGGRAGYHIILHPGERFDFRTAVPFSRGRYDQLHLDAAFVYGRYPVAEKAIATLVKQKDGSVNLNTGKRVLRNGLADDFLL